MATTAVGRSVRAWSWAGAEARQGIRAWPLVRWFTAPVTGGQELPGVSGLTASLVAGIVAAPVLLATYGALRSGWVPWGDEAVIGVRSGDVLGPGSPLLGMPSGLNAYVPADEAPYHPGPLLFWCYALPVRLLGASAGLLLGAAVVNLAALAVALGTTYRYARSHYLAIAAFFAIVAAGAGGAPVLFHALNPIVALLPLAATAVLLWLVACGRTGLLVPATFFASFVVQADVIYVVIVGLIMLWAVGRGRAWSARAGTRWRWGVLGVLAVTWVLPLADAVLNGGGNGGRAAAAITSGALPAGAGLSYAGATVTSATWVRPLVVAASFDGDLVRLDEADFVVAPTGWIVVSLMLLVALLLAARRCGPVSARLAELTVASVLAGAVTAWLLPADEGFVFIHVLWLLPVGALVIVAALDVLARAFARRSAEPRLRLAVPVAVAALALFVLTTSVDPVRLDEDVDGWQYRATRALREDVASGLPGSGPYLVFASGGEPFVRLTSGVIGGLEEQGVRTTTEARITYYGANRVNPDGPAAAALVVLPALSPYEREGTEVLARYQPEGSDPARIRALAEQLVDHARVNGPVRLSVEGASRFRETLFGMVEGACPSDHPSVEDCDVGDRFGERPDLFLDEDPALTLQLYRNGWIAAPQLSEELADQMVEAYEAVPTEVRLLRGPFRDG